MNDIESRISNALHAAAEGVREQDLRPAAPPRAATIVKDRRTVRWVAPLLAAAAVIAVVATSVALSGSPSASHNVPPLGSPSPSGSKSTDSGQPSPASTTVQASKVPQNEGVPACFFQDECATSAQTYYVPLWPFANAEQAKQWEFRDGPDGHSPWHADARATALFFVSGFLHFGDLPIVTSAQIAADQAHIGVGFRDPSGTKHTAAVLHLVRYESTLGDTSAGWEVVGSDDTTFSIEQPSYGSTVSSPMTVGGHITGADENIRVVIRSFDGIVGGAAPLPAGGTNSPWSVTAHFTGHGALTIVAVTGGHLQEHERFAIQGVHA